MILVLIATFFGLMFLAIPVGHVLVAAASASIMMSDGLPLMIVAQQMFQQTQSFPMLALPFFILSGSLMMSGALGKKMIDFATVLVQRYRGGLTSTSVVGSAVFGGVSGSAVADATAIGGMLIPWQKQSGYPAPFCAANNAAASTIAILIPPSIPMILYSLVSDVSVSSLFYAGVLPGLMLTAAFVLVNNISARLRGFPYERKPFDWPKFRELSVQAAPALAMPIFILLFLRFGIATPTEVSVMAVLYSLAAGLFIYRDMTFKRFYDAIISAGVATGVVMLVIMASAIVGWIMTYVQMPQVFSQWALGTLKDPWLIILAMNMIMLVAGMFIDLPAAILLLGPIFVPLAKTIGLDLTQLGLVMVLNLAIGLYTPPVGTTLFISASVARTRIIETTKELFPFYLMALLILFSFSYIPALTLK
ncbi:MAG: TRAP transporter large permease subunit [Proteobacteria bacterium]|nr:TRAP transporter large permease subunit [Pseudomonadota bacterium]